MKKIVGFDIGEKSVKMTLLVGGRLKKAVNIELPDHMVSGGKILSMDAMADFLRLSAKQNDIPFTNAAIVLSSNQVITRELTLPAMTEQQLRFNLPYEFRDYLTEEKSKYFFDYSMREVYRDEDGYPAEMELLACAVLKDTVARYRDMLHRAGFKLQMLTPSECAYASILKDDFIRSGKTAQDICVVNLGYSGTYLHIYRGYYFDSRRVMELGTKELEHLVAEHCGVDIHMAHEYVLQDYNGVLSSDYAADLYARISLEIKKAVNFFNYNNRERELTRLCLCGGGCAIEPLRRAILEATEMTPVTARELLGENLATDEPWLYLRALGCANEWLEEG